MAGALAVLQDPRHLPDPRQEGGVIASRVPTKIFQSVLYVRQQFFWVHYWWDRFVRREVRKVGPRCRCETKTKLKASFIKLKPNRANFLLVILDPQSYIEKNTCHLCKISQNQTGIESTVIVHANKQLITVTIDRFFKLLSTGKKISTCFWSPSFSIRTSAQSGPFRDCVCSHSPFLQLTQQSRMHRLIMFGLPLYSCFNLHIYLLLRFGVTSVVEIDCITVKVVLNISFLFKIETQGHSS